MSGKGGSSLGTLLFSIPLAAIPLMAIFGIPQFAPLVASPERTSGYDRHSDDRAAGRRGLWDRHRGEELEADFEDEDAPDYSPTGRPGVDRNLDDRYAHRGGGREERQDSLARPWPEDSSSAPLAIDRDDADRHPSRVSVNPDAEPAPMETGTQPARTGGLTWQSAAQRFQELGITSYHLEAGSEPLSFLFVCSFCPEANPNVTMRFESEATEPLDAVDDVLAQIDRWQQRQSAAVQ